MIQDKDSAVFQQVEIYYVSDDGTNYVNPESLKAGTTLIKTGVIRDNDSRKNGRVEWRL